MAQSQPVVSANPAGKPSRLGRGLSALMARPVSVHPPAASQADGGGLNQPLPAAAPDATMSSSTPADGILFLPIDRLRPNPRQPRQTFDEAALKRLAESITADGLMQPIVVRPIPPEASGPASSVTHELIAGERRWRAAKLAGLTALPAIVRAVDDRKLAEWALIENLQREDLDPLERAHAFQGLIDRFGLSHDDIAQRVGVDRTTITNTLRLLSLHGDVQALVRTGRLSAGHAKALAGLADLDQQASLATRAVAQDWSVRQAEAAVKAMQAAARGGDPATDGGAVPAGAGGRSVHLADLERQLAGQLKSRVHIKPGRKKGTGSLTIEFYSIEQFDALLARLGVETE